MPWIIVQFSESEEIEALPCCWYNASRRSVLYPPYPRNRMEKAIKNEYEPESDWQEYSVSLMRDTIYDNFRTACSKASKCCLTSEVSELETLSEKRKPKKNKITSSEESGSDLDIPRFQGRKETNHIEKINQESQENNVRKVISSMANKPKQINSGNLRTGIEPTEVESVLLTSDDIKFRKTCIEMLVKNSKLLKDSNLKLQELSEKFDTLSQLSKEKSLPSIEDGAEILDLFKDFPIKNDHMLEHVEKILQNENSFKRLVDELSRIGGKDYKECCRRFLKKIMDDKFASNYSLVGHKHKKVFKTLKICACILEAIQRCNRDTTLKEIEITVSAYLAKASDRLKRQQDITVGAVEEPEQEKEN